MDLIERVQAALGDAFVVEQELPGGGMSRLFLATEASLNRKVVIKLLPPELSSEVSAARFKQEMEFAARLQHPHILPILAAGTREGLLYYLMPYVAGESLRSRLEREGRLPVADATRLLAEVADALAFAHGEGVIHRDIKPENILLEGKHAVLADFGIARALLESRTGSRLTGTGVSIGTPGYMSPEQLSGGNVDARADVYALAVVGYEILAGVTPFAGPSVQAVVTGHLTQTPRPLGELRPEVPPALGAAMAKALAKDPGDRFRTAAEFAEAVASSVAPTPSGPRPVTAAASRRIAWRVAAGVLILTGAGFLLVRTVAERRRTAALLASVEPAAAAGRLDDVASALARAGAALDEGSLSGLRQRVAGRLAVESDPPGAIVTATRVTPIESFAKRAPLLLGRTPVTGRAVVAGEYLIQIESPGRQTAELLLIVGRGDTARVRRSLLPADSSTAGLVPVDAGPSLSGDVGTPFLIGRYEITNAEYLRFVSAGGYHEAMLWPETMTLAGRARPRDEALRLLVDKTGLPGPREWANGKYADGTADHPVVGVSWYEASAYARWAGGTLPTSAQWWRATLGDSRAPWPWGKDAATAELRANFGLAGPTPVGSHPLGISPYGVHDLAGNVREWLDDREPGGERRIALGGSWQDPSYMFERSHAESFEPGLASGVIGLRIVRPAPARAP